MDSEDAVKSPKVFKIANLVRSRLNLPEKVTPVVPQRPPVAPAPSGLFPMPGPQVRRFANSVDHGNQHGAERLSGPPGPPLARGRT